MAQDLLAEGRRLGVPVPAFEYHDAASRWRPNCTVCRTFRNKVRAALAAEADAKARADRMWTFIDAPLRFPSWLAAADPERIATYVPPVPPATPPPPVPVQTPSVRYAEEVIDVYRALANAGIVADRRGLGELALDIVIRSRNE